MEADLRRFYGVRYSDRWRRGPDGSRLLTLREIWVYLDGLSDPHSALAIKLNDNHLPWGVTDYLISDLWRLQSGKTHPARPKSKKQQTQSNVREERVARARQREAQRQDAIRRGEIK